MKSKTGLDCLFCILYLLYMPNNTGMLALELRSIDKMKKIIVLTVVAIVSQAVAIFAGEPVVSSKEVVAPPPPPPPPEFFRPNEFDIGAFGSYAEGEGGR